MNMREDLKAFIDNELSEADRTRILREIEQNPELQAEVIELRQMSRMIREEAWQPEPVGLERTLGALEVAGKRSRTPWWMQNGWALVGASACTILLAIVLFPVFAQSKSAAKRSSEISARKQAQFERDMAMGSEAAGEIQGNMAADMSQGASADMKGGAGGPPATLRGRTEQKSKAERAVYGTSAGIASAPPTTASPAQPRFEIKTAQLAIEVEEVAKAQQDAENIAKAFNGRVQTSSKSDDEGRLASANLTLRVPVRSFELAVNRLRELGRVLNDSLSGEDVTTQVVDVEARLKVMRAEEDQYVELLKETKKIGEVLSVKERLSQVRQEIESLDAQRKSLRDQAAESIIHLSLTERPKPDRPRENENWAEDAWSRAVSGLSAAGRALGSVVVFLFVFSPIWLPIVLLFWWLSRRNR
jgi:hypothetical protein